MCGTDDYKTRLKKYHVQCSRFLILFIYIINIGYWQVLFITQEQSGKSQSATSTFKCRGSTAAVLVLFYFFFIVKSSFVATIHRNKCCYYTPKQGICFGDLRLNLVLPAVLTQAHCVRAGFDPADKKIVLKLQSVRCTISCFGNATLALVI